MNSTPTLGYSRSSQCNRYNGQLIKTQMVLRVVLIENFSIDTYTMILLYNICIDNLLARSFYVGLYACIVMSMIVLC